jgi:hypothetical protein
MGYNGWSNYETWAVALWIDNEQGSYTYSRELAREALDTAREEGHEFFSVEENATAILAHELENEHEQGAPEVEGVYADLLNAALSEVDWREIASNYVEEVAAELEVDTVL